MGCSHVFVFYVTYGQSSSSFWKCIFFLNDPVLETLSLFMILHLNTKSISLRAWSSRLCAFAFSTVLFLDAYGERTPETLNWKIEYRDDGLVERMLDPSGGFASYSYEESPRGLLGFVE